MSVWMYTQGLCEIDAYSEASMKRAATTRWLEKLGKDVRGDWASDCSTPWLTSASDD